MHAQNFNREIFISNSVFCFNRALVQSKKKCNLLFILDICRFQGKGAILFMNNSNWNFSIQTSIFSRNLANGVYINIK